MGIIEEVGSGVQKLKVGDRVVMPFNVACKVFHKSCGLDSDWSGGHCQNCEEGLTAFCTEANKENGFAGAAYGTISNRCCYEKSNTLLGYVAMGPYQGGQAEYVRIPWADFNALLLPPGTDNEADFILLAE